jgi:hypothetical protein
VLVRLTQKEQEARHMIDPLGRGNNHKVPNISKNTSLFCLIFLDLGIVLCLPKLVEW